MKVVGVYSSDIGDNTRKGWDALINGRRLKQLEIAVISSDESAEKIPERVSDEANRLFASIVVRTFKKNGRPGKWYVKYMENKTQADEDAIECCVIANQTKRPFSGRKCWILAFDK
jgi:hypothetical protein